MQRHLRRPAPLGALAFVMLLATAIIGVLLMGSGQRIAAVSPSSAPPDASPAQVQPASPTPTHTPARSPSAPARPSPTGTHEPIATCPFTGEPIGEARELFPLLISIDNHPASRPQSYLSAADVVIEATVQGNTTRLTALFACQQPAGAVGPVRSGRFYHIDLHQEFHVPVVVFGAAGYTIDRFDATLVPYVDGSTTPISAFSRAADRQAPYNVYLDSEEFRRLFADGRLGGAMAGQARSPWAFASGPGELSGGRSVSNITIQTSAHWGFGWSFDAGTQQYTRIDGSVPGTDRATVMPLQRRTVVVQRVVQERSFADLRPAADPPLHRLVGAGEGTVYSGGSAVDVRWSRPTADDQTTWTRADSGAPLVLPPGKIWWEIIPTTALVTER